MRLACEVHHLGLMDYDQAWALQNSFAEQIASGDRPPTLLLLEHPHTYTFGRRGRKEHLLWDENLLASKGITVRWVDRGGDVTYHGPGQLVGYPLLPLAPKEFWHSSASDLKAAPQPQVDYVGYMRKLEKTLILALLRLGVIARQVSGYSGVWVESEATAAQPNSGEAHKSRLAKIAAIGVKVDAKGVTRHGFALNVHPDMSYWEGIIGCGLKGYAVTSLAEVLHPTPNMQTVSDEVVRAFGEVFSYTMVDAKQG